MKFHWSAVGTMALSLLAAAAPAANLKNFTYLALGDSIPFGFDPTLFATSIPAPDAFFGYPELLTNPNAKKLLNAACPGETSASFLVLGAPDNGCNGPGPQGQPPFKPSIGLKADYPNVSQMQFAVAQLQGNKHVKLVTLSLGGNDLSLLQAACAQEADFQRCVLTRLPGVLGNFGAQLTQILTGIRREYDGRLVLVTTYSPTADPLSTGAIAAMNLVMAAVGSQFGVRIADGFTAFRVASARFGGDPCQAGLLVRLSVTTCDIHPSALGRSTLADAVRRVN
jgi:lysophospholipase L1-like esterase